MKRAKSIKCQEVLRFLCWFSHSFRQTVLWSEVQRASESKLLHLKIRPAAVQASGVRLKKSTRSKQHYSILDIRRALNKRTSKCITVQNFTKKFTLLWIWRGINTQNRFWDGFLWYLCNNSTLSIKRSKTCNTGKITSPT